MKVIRPVPVKLILKNIATWYNDKTQNSKDSKIIRNQTMAEYLYDLTYNKYGIPSLTDKKLKEIWLSCVLNQSKLPTIDLFSRFIGLSSEFYTNDDLRFYYNINQLMFEQSSHEKSLQFAISIITKFFNNTIPPEDMQTLVSSLRETVIQNEYNENDMDTAQLMIICIDAFKKLKYEVYQHYKFDIKRMISRYPSSAPEKSLDPISPIPPSAELAPDPYLEMYTILTYTQYFAALDLIDNDDLLNLFHSQPDSPSVIFPVDL